MSKRRREGQRRKAEERAEKDRAKWAENLHRQVAQMGLPLLSPQQVEVFRRVDSDDQEERPLISAEEWYTTDDILEMWRALFPESSATAKRMMLHAGLTDADVIRCLYRNPLEPFAFFLDNKGARALAIGVRTGDTPPTVLADYLEDEGADERIVRHLRTDRGHVQNCWALRAVLGPLKPFKFDPSPTVVRGDPLLAVIGKKEAME